MSDALLAVLAAVVGGVVGRAIRPVVARYDAALTSSVPTVEVFSAGLFALAATRYDDWRLAPVLVFLAVCVALTVVDLKQYRLPNDILFPGIAVCTALIALGELIEGNAGALARGALGGGLYFVVLFVLHLVNPSGMGFGDVKLAVLLGWFCGWVSDSGLEAVRAVMLALLIGSVLGLVLGLGRILVLRRGSSFLPDPEEGSAGSSARNTTFPFGPPLMAATIAIVLYPGPLLG